MKRNLRKKTAFICLSFALAAFYGVSAFAAKSMNFWGDYSGTNGVPHVDVTQPVSSGRSYFVTAVQPATGGAKVSIDMYHGDLNAPVSVYLQIAINDGKGNVKDVTLKTLDNNLADNPTNYHSHREYSLDYADLNAQLKKLLPPTAAPMEIGPGTPLFLTAYWSKYDHTWGGLGRGGIFFLPEDPTAPTQLTASGLSRRPEELDLGVPITHTMAMRFNKNQNGKSVGLQVGGQIRSRLEKEGKYQIPLHETETLKQKLFAMANDPAIAQSILGPDWKVVAEMRYMKKDPQGNLILDKNGMPTPDPMVDTYYDNDHFDGAKNDVAIRYRWTEGNGTGAWNFKPGMTQVSADGVVDRLEFGMDTTDDKPGTIEQFADSNDPLNFLREIRRIIPGSTPSHFLKPAVKIEDVRYKFKLQHTNGLVIEMSLDNVHAHSLRSGAKVKYTQLEMDVDHLATASQNVLAATSGFSGVTYGQGYAVIDASTQTFLNALDSQAFLDGRPILHTDADLDPSSTVLQKHQSDFALAETAIKSIRDSYLGADWLPAPQKASLAAYLLGEVSDAHASKSVKALLDRAKAVAPKKELFARDAAVTKICPTPFN